MTDKKEIRLSVRSFDEVTRNFIEYYSERDLKKREAMDKPEYGGYEAFSAAGGPFICSIEGNAIEVERYVFTVYFLPDEKRLQVQALIKADNSPIISEPAPKEYRGKKGFSDEWFRYADDFKPIAESISGYKLTAKDIKRFKRMMSRTGAGDAVTVDPGINEAFGSLLKAVLEDAGYVVTIERPPDYYFPSPTSMGYVAPPFGLGISKKIEPDVVDGYETTYIYFSQKKPQSKTQVQLKVFDIIPSERLREIDRSFRDNLSPYGLKCLYLVMEECAHNRRNPWFILDTNRCLDIMKYKRNKKGVHRTENKNRFLEVIGELTQIEFNIERRVPGKRNKDKVIKFNSPLLSVTGKFEEWEVERGKPTESGIQIENNVQIFLHPEIYKYIDNWYTIIPRAFLTIDAKDKPYAILLYSYIANQWRIGWNKYEGVIKQSMRQTLDGAGLLTQLPKRANQQRETIKKIKNNLKWLRTQDEYWIESVKFEGPDRLPLNQTVIINMAETHPLRTSMGKQIDGV